jgi:epoxyqueuosine reductase
LQEGVLDARRCLSYLTIENRGPIPEELRPLLGEWVFGCDRCQQACPWNQRMLKERAHLPVPPNAALYLPEVLFLSAGEFRERFRDSPIWRATPEGLARNAAVVLGNLGDPAAAPHLAEAVRAHPSELVREHAAWALRRLEETGRR